MTENEQKIVRLLATSAGTDYSINEIAKECGMNPNGAYKILVKLENEGTLLSKRIANIKSYKINFHASLGVLRTNFAFVERNHEGRIKARMEDLACLKSLTKACMFYGSYITTKKNPGDLDVLFVIDRNSYGEFMKKLVKVKATSPIIIHELVQTTEDLLKNLKSHDPVIVGALRNGLTLWGYETLVGVIRRAEGQDKEVSG